LAFTLDDTSSQKTKSNLFGVPGEGMTSANIKEVTSTSPPDNNSEDTSPPSPVTSIPSNETKDIPSNVPAEGVITITADIESDDGFGPGKNEDKDQRIAFIERLMGLHLAAAASNNSPSEDNSSSTSTDEEDNDRRVKWSPNSLRRKPSQLTESNSQGVPMEPHPMLRYAAAAMMSRLIAAAARAQMETQAREQALMMRGLMSAGKDKDDTLDSEEESVPVLLASLRSERMLSPPIIMSGSSMYGRPRNSRGPLDLGIPSIQARSRMMMLASESGSPMAALHPILQQLQALSALQRLQQETHRERGSRSRDSFDRESIMMMGSQNEKQGSPALVMVAIPMGENSPRSEVMMMSPQRHSPFRSYYPSSYRGGPPPPPVYPSYPYPPPSFHQSPQSRAYYAPPPPQHPYYASPSMMPLGSRLQPHHHHPHHNFPQNH